LQLPCQPWRSPPWSTCSLGALLDAPCGQGRSASTASAWRSSFLCRSAWCRVLLLSLPPSSSEPSCSPCWIASSLEPRWTLPVVEVNRPPGHPRSLRANASPGQLACLPRPLSAQPRLLPAIHRNPPRPLLVGAKPTPGGPRSRPPSAQLSGGRPPRQRQSRPALLASHPARSSPMGGWADDGPAQISDG